MQIFEGFTTFLEVFSKAKHGKIEIGHYEIQTHRKRSDGIVLNKGRSLIVTLLESLSLYHVMEGGGCESRTQSSWIVWPASPFFSPEMET